MDSWNIVIVVNWYVYWYLGRNQFSCYSSASFSPCLSEDGQHILILIMYTNDQLWPPPFHIFSLQKSKPQVSRVMIYSQCTFCVSKYEWHAVLWVGYRSRDLLRRQFIYWNVFRYWKLVPCITLGCACWDLKPHIFIWQTEFGEEFCRKRFMMSLIVV